MNLNHLRNLSLIGYTALIPVALLTDWFCRFFLRHASLAMIMIGISSAATDGNLELVQLVLEVYKSKMRSQGSTEIFDQILEIFPLPSELIPLPSELKFHYENILSIILSCAATHGQVAIVQYALDEGADIDKADENGYTSLHDAARNGRIEAVMLLMRSGADLNVRDNNGLLPIDLAVNEEMRLAIRDEPRRRRMDHGFKRAIEQDRHPITDAAAIAPQQEDDDDGNNESSDDDDDE